MALSKKYLFILIAAFFLLTRLYCITSIPTSLYWDEASIGYNAYSILKTGRDEWGEFLPLHFRAFGEFKLPIYIYSVAIVEAIFGLSEFAVRLPAVLFSLGTVILTYLLASKITKSKEIGLLSSFLLSVTPWFFIYSRTGYEAMAGLFFYMLGIYAFHLGFKDNKYIYLSILSFVATIYSYNSFRIITPLTVIFLIGFMIKSWREDIKKLITILGIWLIVFAIALLPIVKLVIKDNGASRIETVGILSAGTSYKSAIKIFAKNYVSHFNPNFLFISGDTNLRSGTGYMGELFWIQLPLVFLGIIYIVKSHKYWGWFVLVPIILAPIPAAITRESPHALRAIALVPFVSILSSFGIVFIVNKVRYKTTAYLFVTISFLIFFSLYFYNFLYVYPEKAFIDWQSPYKQIYLQYGTFFKDYDHILISDSLGQPYIFSLFYLGADPKTYTAQRELNPIDKWGFSAVDKYKNLTFDKINIEMIPDGKVLIFATPQESIANLALKGTINNMKGEITFYVYESKKN